MNNEILCIVILIILYIYFNNTQHVISVPMPKEKMSNVSIYTGDL